MASPSPSRRPAAQPARLSSRLRISMRRPATAQRICALWWSMRPGRNCTSAVVELTASTRAKAPAQEPPRLSASRATTSERPKNSSTGQIMRVASSAVSTPSKGVSTRIRTASGRSISRDQCETSGSGAPMRGSVVSNQGAPAISSRTVTSRTASSGSPSQSESGTPCPKARRTRSAVASSDQMSGAAEDRRSAGNGRWNLCVTCTAIARRPLNSAQPYATRLRGA